MFTVGGIPIAHDGSTNTECPANAVEKIFKNEPPDNNCRDAEQSDFKNLKI